MGPIWQLVLGVLTAVVLFLLLLLSHRKRGHIGRKALAAWMRELGLMLKHRVPLDVALIAGADAAPKRLTRLSMRFRELVFEGECLSDALFKTIALPRAVLATITAGEVFGTLPDALIDASDMLSGRGRGTIGPSKRQLLSTEAAQEHPVYEVTAGPSGKIDFMPKPGDDCAPIVRVAQSILAQAIQSGAEYIEFEPVRTEKPPRHQELQDEEEWHLMDLQIGPQILVIFGRGRDNWEAMRVPMYIAAPLYRRIKIMAEVPYWQKPPLKGHMILRFADREYNIHMDGNAHPLGEKLRLQISTLDNFDLGEV